MTWACLDQEQGTVLNSRLLGLPQTLGFRVVTQLLGSSLWRPEGECGFVEEAQRGKTCDP